MKPGYQTTEFFVAIAPVITAVMTSGKDTDLFLIAAVLLGALYIASRTFIKWKHK